MSDSIDLTLYGESTWVSPWVFHVMVALEEKRLPYKLELVPLPIPVDVKAKLQQNAVVGKVPILAHGDLWITESLAISEYLAERFPAPDHPRLFPRSRRALAPPGDVDVAHEPDGARETARPRRCSGAR
jgi:glutathione S-transferase